MGFFGTMKEIWILTKCFKEVWDDPDNDYPSPSWFKFDKERAEFYFTITNTIVMLMPELALTCPNGLKFSLKTLKAIHYTAKKLEDAGFNRDQIIVRICKHMVPEIQQKGILYFTV